MKKILLLIVTFISFINIKSQQEPFSKGSLLLFWGYNRSAYTNSDIRFEGPGYSFQLHNVEAVDKPTPFNFNKYFGKGHLTSPQLNYKVAYFIKDRLAIMFSVDHMKYVMKQNQTVDFSGYIDDPNYSTMINNGSIDLSDKNFLTFEHTDGLNYINVGLENYKSIVNHKNFDFLWGYGAGGGALFPKTNAKLFGFDRSDRFHVAGFGLDVRTSLNFVLFKNIVLRWEGKYGYINMPDIKTRDSDHPDHIAKQDFAFFQSNIGLGLTFGLKKNK